MSDKSELVSVMEPLDATTAEVARGILENAGIPVFLQSYQVPWHSGIMTAAAGAWGRILVPADRAEDASRVLGAYFEGEDTEPNVQTTA